MFSLSQFWPTFLKSSCYMTVVMDFKNICFHQQFTNGGVWQPRFYLFIFLFLFIIIIIYYDIYISLSRHTDFFGGVWRPRGPGGALLPNGRPRRPTHRRPHPRRTHDHPGLFFASIIHSVLILFIYRFLLPRFSDIPVSRYPSRWDCHLPISRKLSWPPDNLGLTDTPESLSVGLLREKAAG